jgi:hypothetical protein
MAMSCIVTGSAGELAEWRPQVEDLSAHAAQPNIFFEPGLLGPALETLATSSLEIVLFLDPGDSGRLIGLFPFERTASFHGLPLPALRTWQHLHCFLGTPLVRSGAERMCFAELLHWLDAREGNEIALELRSFGDQGGLWDALQEVLDQDGRYHFSTTPVERALLEPDSDVDAYLLHVLGSKKLKELRRQQRRLAEQGKMEFETLSDNGDVDEWIRDFLELESSGWKGDMGTAMRQTDSERQYFERVVREAFRLNRLLMLRLRLDGRTVSSQVNFRTGKAGFAFKVAFDERYAKYSPGLLLELENVRQRFAQRDLDWMDSCSNPHSNMIGRLWSGRRVLHTACISTSHPLSKPSIQLFRIYCELRERTSKTTITNMPNRPQASLMPGKNGSPGRD